MVLDTIGLDGRARAVTACERLKTWLSEAAYPLWSDIGFDAVTGRFREKIGQDGAPLDLPSRGRVPPRQIYAYAAAASLGWRGDAGRIVRDGLAGFLRDFRRGDGPFRLLDPTGRDGGALDLYDQAFALFGLAAAHPFIEGGLERMALALRLALRRRLSHPLAGFRPSWPPRLPLESNPQMHLLEACLAWAELSPDPGWRAMADEIVELATMSFIDPASGALREFFADDWTPAPGEAGRIVEPGHQFEWAWLLLRQAERLPGARSGALRLIDLAERHGVDPVRGVVMDALLDDLSVFRREARLWPQTERIKAASLAARLTGEARHWERAAQAAQALERYLATPIRGVWYDRMKADGRFVNEPAPASSFYHIVLAISVLDDCLGG